MVACKVYRGAFAYFDSSRTDLPDLCRAHQPNVWSYGYDWVHEIESNAPVISITRFTIKRGRHVYNDGRNVLSAAAELSMIFRPLLPSAAAWLLAQKICRMPPIPLLISVDHSEMRTRLLFHFLLGSLPLLSSVSWRCLFREALLCTLATNFHRPNLDHAVSPQPLSSQGRLFLSLTRSPSTGSNGEIDNEGPFSGSSMQRGETDGNTLAIDRYVGEKDAWKKFTATGEKSDRIRSVDRKSKKWDDKLEKIPPKKS